MSCIGARLSQCTYKISQERNNPTVTTTQEEQAANIRASMKASTDAMSVQTKAMSDQITQLTKVMANNENTSSGGGSGGGNNGGHGGRQDKGQAKCKIIQYTKTHSMGCYCWSYGFQPVGKTHTSATCQWQQPNHDVMARWNDRKGGSIHWPPPIQVSIEQQSLTWGAIYWYCNNCNRDVGSYP